MCSNKQDLLFADLRLDVNPYFEPKQISLSSKILLANMRLEKIRLKSEI